MKNRKAKAAVTAVQGNPNDGHGAPKEGHAERARERERISNECVCFT